jgi:hypothetical protein
LRGLLKRIKRLQKTQFPAAQVALPGRRLALSLGVGSAGEPKGFIF